MAALPEVATMRPPGSNLAKPLREALMRRPRTKAALRIVKARKAAARRGYRGPAPKPKPEPEQ